MRIFLALVLLFSTRLAIAQDLNQWVDLERGVALRGMLQNISPAGTQPGIVVASPSQDAPNYYFHWVRDAALTMDTVVTLYAQTQDAALKSRYRDLILNYMRLSQSNQRASDFGEPKFEVNGQPFRGEWMRPQNDGPALRAITLTRFAQILFGERQISWIRTNLYRGVLPADTLIKADLEFVAHHWNEVSYDLWEEVRGDHFYTRAVQRRALIDGANLAFRMGDPGGAAYYLRQAALIGESLNRHWDPARGVYAVTLNVQGDHRGKHSLLDVAVVLGALHGGMDVTDSKLLASAEAIRRSFVPIYAVNARATDAQGGVLGTAIGRYPEDLYDGTGMSRGNPWVLATQAYAEFCYRVATRYSTLGRIVVDPLSRRFLEGMVPTIALRESQIISRNDPQFESIVNGIRAAGDSFLRRVRLHAFPNGALSEQMNRDTGYMQGARDLTWNYASFLTAVFAR